MSYNLKPTAKEIRFFGRHSRIEDSSESRELHNEGHYQTFLELLTRSHPQTTHCQPMSLANHKILPFWECEGVAR